MWSFDNKTKKFFNSCEMLEKCCFQCKNRLDNSCLKNCFNEKQEEELSEKYETAFHCKNCEHK